VRLGKNDAAVIVKYSATGEEQALPVSPRPVGWVGDYSPDSDMGLSWLTDGQFLMISDGAADQNSHTVPRVLAGRRTSSDRPDWRPGRRLLPGVSPDARQLALVHRSWSERPFPGLHRRIQSTPVDLPPAGHDRSWRGTQTDTLCTAPPAGKDRSASGGR